jgi:hypothetical protein
VFSQKVSVRAGPGVVAIDAVGAALAVRRA